MGRRINGRQFSHNGNAVHFSARWSPDDRNFDVKIWSAQHETRRATEGR